MCVHVQMYVCMHVHVLYMHVHANQSALFFDCVLKNFEDLSRVYHALIKQPVIGGCSKQKYAWIMCEGVMGTEVRVVSTIHHCQTTAGICDRE